MTTKWNRGKIRELLYIICGLTAYCIIAMVFGLPCPIKWLTGISCPGCGMTRSVLALLQLRFADAFHYHPLVFYVIIVAPFLVIFHLRDMNKIAKRLLIFSAGLMIAIYLLRFLVWDSSVLSFAPQDGVIGKIILKIRSIFV